jgi:NifU-like protein involved in Fe-S cluster formation
MTDALIAYYRKLMNTGFDYSGMVENASITLENFGEVSPVCGNPDDYMRLYIRVDDDTIQDIRYSCITDPTTNVALEILCALMMGRTLNEAADVKEDAFSSFLGSEDKGLQEKAKELLKLFNTGILKYKSCRQTG